MKKIKRKPTPSQQFLMDLIKMYQKKFKKDPTAIELAKALGRSESSVRQRLQKLRVNKFIKRDCCLMRPNHPNIKY